MKKVTNAERLKTALRYSKLGLAILPVYGVVDGQCQCGHAENCNRSGKHPMTEHGVKDASADTETVKAYWKKHPNANIGIATGAKSGIIVVDLDPRNGGKQSLQKAIEELGILPNTPKTITGNKGSHFIFRYPETKVRSDTAGKLLGPGLDVLSDGSYFVAPGSQGVKGKYLWVKDRSISKLQPAELPKAWLDRLTKGLSASTTASNDASVGVQEGQRNNQLASLAGSLHRAGVSPEGIAAALTAENAKCIPPLSAGEVAGIVNSISSYPPGPGISEATDPALNLALIVLAKFFAGGQHLMREQGRFWVYDNTHWHPASDDWVKSKVLGVIEETGVKVKSTTSSLLSQALQILQARLAVNDDRLGLVAEPLPVINTVNGELWIGEEGSAQRRDHNPASGLRHCLDIVYDPSATCPKYDQALEGIFSAAENPKSMIRHWHELVGYIIQPRRNIPLIVIGLGKGGNGKTQLMSTVIKLLGEHLVCAQQISNFDSSRFAMASLFGKHLLLDDDVAAGARLPDGFLKTVSESKVVSGEEKYKSPFNFRVRTVPVLLCNNVPSLADLSPGMERRLMVIPFDKSFSKKEMDIDLFVNIWAGELPGILNRAIEGLRRLRERGSKFRIPDDVIAATKKFTQDANPLPAFIDERCVRESSSKVYLENFYKAFERYLEENGNTLKSQKSKVKLNLLNLGYVIKRHSLGYVVKGLRLK